MTKARWYVYDGLGSVVGEVDPLGNLTSSPKYDVYGATRSNAGTATSKQGFVGSLGHVSDDTGLVYMRARYMDPSIGRFVSEDPAGDGSNWFVYVRSNPITGQDESGKIEGEDDLDEADGEVYVNVRGEIANFTKARRYSSQGMKNEISKMLDCDDNEAGEVIHAAKKGMGGAANDRNPDILLDKYGALWTKTGVFLGFVEDFAP